MILNFLETHNSGVVSPTISPNYKPQPSNTGWIAVVIIIGVFLIATIAIILTTVIKDKRNKKIEFEIAEKTRLSQINNKNEKVEDELQKEN